MPKTYASLLKKNEPQLPRGSFLILSVFLVHPFRVFIFRKFITPHKVAEINPYDIRRTAPLESFENSDLSKKNLELTR